MAAHDEGTSSKEAKMPGLETECGRAEQEAGRQEEP